MGVLYDASFAKSDKVKRRNHGTPWLESDLSRLIERFRQGRPLQEIAIELGLAGSPTSCLACARWVTAW